MESVGDQSRGSGVFSKYHKNPLYTDIKIYTGGELIPAHRIVLDSWSPKLAEGKWLDLSRYHVSTTEYFIAYLYNVKLDGGGLDWICWQEVMDLATEYNLADLAAELLELSDFHPQALIAYAHRTGNGRVGRYAVTAWSKNHGVSADESNGPTDDQYESIRRWWKGANLSPYRLLCMDDARCHAMGEGHPRARLRFENYLIVTDLTKFTIEELKSALNLPMISQNQIIMYLLELAIHYAKRATYAQIMWAV